MVKQKIVMKLSMQDPKKRSKALRSAVGSDGVMSASLDGDNIVVVGEGTDSISLTTTLRKRVGFAELISVTTVEEKKKEEETSTTVQPMPWSYPIQIVPQHPVYQYPYNDSSCNIM